MEERPDDDFGFVRRDTDVLRRAIESEGARAGSKRQEPEAGPPPAPVSGEGDRAPQQVRASTVAPPSTQQESVRKTTVGKSAGKAGGILKKMSAPSSGPTLTPPKEDDLPQRFQVKYLGSRDARGLWGIKHTRRPVDALVAAAKGLPPGVVLPMVRLTVSRDGVAVGSLAGGGATRVHPIDTISYGVQDLVYTRVFSMIVVRESSPHNQHQHPFECHAFVCDSRAAARRLTYSLAAAFNEYSKVVRASGGGAAAGAAAARKKFAIDLRTPEEIEAELNSAPHDVDSEA